MKKNIYNIIKCISVSLLSLVASCDMLPDEQLYDYGGAEVDNAPVASEQLPITGEINGYGYVDLGLPSGIKWAVCNVGAEYPWEYGGYYAWGETEEKEDYCWETYEWCNGSYDTMTKYCTDSSYGTVDNKTTLDPEDDVAHVKWGGSWRMPTKAEQDELRTNCTWQWTTHNGVDGYKVTGSNGNCIFLPAAGYRGGTNLYYRVSSCDFWSGSLDGSYSYNAYYLNFAFGNNDWSYDYRYYGLCVRPVCGEPAAPVEKCTVTVNSAGNGGVAIKDKDGTSAEIERGSTITVVATPDEGYAFYGWYVEGNEEPVSTDAEYTFTVSEGVSLVAMFREKTYIDGYEYVDLGLPSGIKWAAYNVGATKPEEYGGYYAWGETEEKENYGWNTYKWCNGSSSTMTKYCTDSSYGTVDNKTTLALEDDVAHVKWGGSWRMPTKIEQDELLNNCTWTWTTQNGVNGYMVTSKTNGNSIFLPAAGNRYGTNLLNSGSGGDYWSSSLRGSDSYVAYDLYFNSGGYSWSNLNRYGGLSVRPVCGEPAAPVEKYTVTVNSAGNGNVVIKDKDDTAAEIETGATVTVVATPDEGYAFDGWYIDGNEEPVSSDAEYTFTVSDDIALVARFEQIVYEAVDLGLSIKWATCNVGATKPEEYGGYYAWGETEEKENYSWSTYKWCKGSSTTMTKYCTSNSYGTVDNKTTLALEDDVAHVKCGGSWRMPTKAEQDELCNSCTWTWTTQNGVNGYMVTSKTNGNSIFLPAAGYRDGANLYSSGSNGYYWSSSLRGSDSYVAYDLYFNSGYYYWSNLNRYYGHCVRPVSE